MATYLAQINEQWLWDKRAQHFDKKPLVTSVSFDGRKEITKENLAEKFSQVLPFTVFPEYIILVDGRFIIEYDSTELGRPTNKPTLWINSIGISIFKMKNGYVHQAFFTEKGE